MIRTTRYALRQLWSQPGFTLAALLSLALGIGATTAVFSVFYAAILNPFPYVNADRLARIFTADQGGNLRPVSLTGSQLRSLRQSGRVESAVAWLNWELNTTGSDLPEDVKAVFITSNAAGYFGVPPLLGRNIAPSDTESVVVLTYSFWSCHFGRNPEILGKTLELAHREYRIIGVLPPRFTWNGGDVYLPLTITYDQTQLYGISVRLRSGISLHTAASELQPLFDRFAQETPARYPARFHIRLERLNDQYIKTMGRTLYLLFGAVGLLLLIGCTNVSILLLARGAGRQRELAIRFAIGASRLRVLLQLLTESLALSLVGAALGVATAYSIVTVVAKWFPAPIDLPVLAFCVILAVLVGLLFGLFPALQIARPELEQTLRTNAQNLAGGMRTKRTHQLMIGGQIALTLLLLTAAGSSIEGFRRVTQVHLGYNPHSILDVNVPLHTNSYVSQQARFVYFEALRKKVTALPGVTSVALTGNAVPPYSGAMQHIELLTESNREWRQASVNLVSGNYFSTLQIPLLKGNAWNQIDSARAAHLAVINQAMAQQFWPQGDPIGQTIRLPELKPQPPFRVAAPDSTGSFRIAGIVADFRNNGLLAPAQPAVYIPTTVWMDMGIDLLVQTKNSPPRIIQNIRKQLASVNPDQQIAGFTPTLEELIELQPEWQQDRLITLLCAGFASVALILALIGLYSVVSYAVARRTSEFGIRMALGASPKQIFAAALSSFGASVSCGLAAGALLAFALDSYLTKLTEGRGHHFVTLAIAAALLIAACTCACLVPARRAASIFPLIALRHE